MFSLPSKHPAHHHAPKPFDPFSRKEKKLSVYPQSKNLKNSLLKKLTHSKNEVDNCIANIVRSKKHINEDQMTMWEWTTQILNERIQSNPPFSEHNDFDFYNRFRRDTETRKKTFDSFRASFCRVRNQVPLEILQRAQFPLKYLKLCERHVKNAALARVLMVTEEQKNAMTAEAIRAKPSISFEETEPNKGLETSSPPINERNTMNDFKFETSPLPASFWLDFHEDLE